MLIGTPDHWHALTAIAAMEAGADLYLQKPISVDVKEGEAILSAARKFGRVVQVGLQRRSTPHLVEARDKVVREGKLGKVGLVEICCYWHMRDTRNLANTAPKAEPLDYEMWTGPAPDAAVVRHAVACVHGILATASWATWASATCSTCVRWMLGLGWPKRVSSSAAASSSTRRARPTPPTRKPSPLITATCRSSGSIACGARRPI